MSASLLLALLSLVAMNASARSLTISGISSGGFMASQMATIYSDQFSGVATVAGGVFYCAENKFQENLKTFGSLGYFSFGVNTANIWKSMGFGGAQINSKSSANQSMIVPLSSNPIFQSVAVCMGHPEGSHSPETLTDGRAREMDLNFLKDFESKHLIADTANIAKQRVLIYQGQNDQIVRPEMADKLKEFYSRLGVSASDLKVMMEPGNHNFPTTREDGFSCSDTRVPFIANCQRDTAGDILEHLLERKLVRGQFNILHLKKIEQKGAPTSLASYGYLYATPFCLNNPTACDLHVALHGCQMSDDFDANFQSLYQNKVQLTHLLGVSNYEMMARRPQMGALSFARRSGYAEYAEDVSNNVMILFPQTQITSANYPANPNGCWDWFGWTGSDYATNKGSETSWLNTYIQQIRQNPRALVMNQVKVN